MKLVTKICRGGYLGATGAWVLKNSHSHSEINILLPLSYVDKIVLVRKHRQSSSGSTHEDFYLGQSQHTIWRRL